MRLAFLGTPEFAATVLAALLAAGHEIAAVYSQPPRPAGRGQKLRNSPVHELALRHGIAVRTPKTLRDPAEQARFAALDLDAAVVAAYGLILPQRHIRNLDMVRYVTTMVLVVSTMSVLLKMGARLAFNIKYVLTIPSISMNF